MLVDALKPTEKGQRIIYGLMQFTNCFIWSIKYLLKQLGTISWGGKYC